MLDSIFKYLLSFLCSVRRYGWIRFSFLELEVETLRVAIFGCWFRARLLARLVLMVPAFEVLSDKKLIISDKIKIYLIKKLSECSGHSGIAGGQFLDLSFENKKISRKKIVDMAIKKTGKLFSFCCATPAILKGKDKSVKII